MHVMDALSVRNGNVIHKQIGPGALVFYPDDDLLPPPYQLSGDGMIRFALHFPSTTSVVLRYGTHTMEMSRQDDVWTAQCAALSGFQRIQVILDGCEVLCPCFPIGFMENQPCNYIDLTETCQENIPSGSVVSEFF